MQEKLLPQKLELRQLDPTSYQADNCAGLREDILSLMNKREPEQAHAWGSLRAWAWGSEKELRTLNRAQNTIGLLPIF